MGPGTVYMLADAVECVMMLKCTGLSGAAWPVQTRKPVSTELCVGRQPVEHFQPIHESPSVIIGCNPRRSLEGLRVDTGNHLQNIQFVPTSDALTMVSPLSVP